MNVRRHRLVPARDVSLRRRGRIAALAIVVGCLFAVPSAYAQDQQPTEETEPAPAPAETGEAAPSEAVEPTETSTASEVARLYFDAGKAYFNNGQFAEAIDEFRKAYQLVSTAAIAFNIARCHEKLSELKDAIEWYEIYIKKTEDPKERAEIIERVENLRRKLGGDDDSVEARYRARVEAGRTKYRAGDYEGAIEDFKAAFDIKASPNPLYNIAKSYESIGRWEEAADYFQQYLDIDPNATDRAKVEALIKDMQRRIRDRFRELTVSTEPPGADVYIDDIEAGIQGQTPKTLKLKPGRHKLYVSLNGYEPVEKEFDVSNQNLTLDFKLKKLENVGTLQIDVTADGNQLDGARIFIDGAIVGLSPYSQKKKLVAGVHQVQIEKPGYDRYTEQITIVKEEEMRLVAELEEYDPPISDKTLTSWGSSLVLTGLIGGSIGFFTPLVIQEATIRRPYYEDLGPSTLGNPYRVGAPGENPNTRENSELKTMQLIQTISLIAGGTLVVAGSVFYIVKWTRDVPPAPVTAGIYEDRPIVTIDSVGFVPTPDGGAVGLSGSF